MELAAWLTQIVMAYSQGVVGSRSDGAGSHESEISSVCVCVCVFFFFFFFFLHPGCGCIQATIFWMVRGET